MTFVLLPPANEVCEGYLFRSVCQSFCSQEGSASVHAGVHPPAADTPWEQTPHNQAPPGSRIFSRPGTPPRGRHHPLEKTPPPRADTPPAQCMLGYTVNKRAVRILVECNFVTFLSQF